MELELLYRALRAKIGIIVTVDDMSKARAKLYSARREAADPELSVLELRVSPFAPKSELWIMKSKQDAPSS